MAYSGGTYTKPISFGGSGIADLYLKGKMQVVNMRAQVRNERSKELSEYAKAASQIEASGVSEADKLYQSAANQLRDAAVRAHNDNILGFTNKSFATSKLNNYISQASQVANASKLVAANIEEINEQIKKDGPGDALSLARYKRSWFTEKGGPQQWIKKPDGKGGFETVPGSELLAMEFSEDEDKLYYRKSFNYFDPNTSDIKVGTILRSPSNLANGSASIIQRFDTNDWVKDLKGTIGTRHASVVRGQSIDDIPGYLSTFRIGETDGFTRVVTTENLRDISSSIELRLNTFATDDEKVMSFLSQEFGSRAVGDEGHNGLKSEDEINKLFGATEVLGANGKPTGEKIPKLYDELGNQIEFTNRDADGNLIDPLTFQLNQYGTEQITDDQRNLAKAILRDRALKAFDVKLQDYKERDRLKSGAKDTDTNFETTAATYSYVDKGTGTLVKGANADTEYLKSKAILSSLAVLGSTGKVSAYNKAKANINKNGRYTLGGKLFKEKEITMNEELSSFIKFSEKSGVVTKGINIPMDISKKINKQFGLTSTNNKALTDIEQVFFVNDPSGGDTKPQLAFIGKTIISKKQDVYQNEDGGKEAPEVKLKLEEQGQVVTEGISIASPSDVSRFYKLMYENNPQFKDAVENLGFKGITAKNVNDKNQSQIEDALFSYFNTI